MQLRPPTIADQEPNDGRSKKHEAGVLSEEGEYGANRPADTLPGFVRPGHPLRLVIVASHAIPVLRIGIHPHRCAHHVLHPRTN
jgi:hypothetical protein